MSRPRDQDTRQDMPPAPLAWTRAASFGAVAGSVGVIGHALAASVPVSLPVLGATVTLGTLAARPLASRRATAPGLLAALVAMQAMVHVASGSVGGVPVGAHGHMSMTGHAGLAMYGVHALALLAGLVILLMLEGAAWAAVSDLVTRVRRLLGGGHAHAARDRCAPASPSLHHRQPTRRAPRRAHPGRTLRGPPVRVT